MEKTLGYISCFLLHFFCALPLPLKNIAHGRQSLKPDKTFYFAHEGEGQDTKSITYHQLKKNVTLLASALKNLGIKKGDRVVGMYSASLFSILVQGSTLISLVLKGAFPPVGTFFTQTQKE